MTHHPKSHDRLVWSAKTDGCVLGVFRVITTSESSLPKHSYRMRVTGPWGSLEAHNFTTSEEALAYSQRVCAHMATFNASAWGGNGKGV
jgi:hypothetical protein